MTRQIATQGLVVITGGAGHVGLACARAFSEYRILISDLRADAVNAAVSNLRADGMDVCGHAADITHDSQARELAHVAAGMGGFQVLVHAAGVAPPAPPEIIYAVNLFGTINVLAAFESLATPDSAGICIASLAGHRKLGHRFDDLLLDPKEDAGALAARIEAECPSTPKSRLAYAVSKRGTILQVQRHALAWGRRRARLLSVSPGVLADTDMGAARRLALAPNDDESTLGRLGLSTEIAQVVRFGASPAASIMTGTDLLADSGFLAEAEHRFDAARLAGWHALEF